MQVTNIQQNQWWHAMGKWKGRTTNEHKETFEDDEIMCYLDCGDSFIGVLMSNLIKKMYILLYLSILQ